MRTSKLPSSTLLILSLAAVSFAQEAPRVTVVPKLVRFSGSFRPATGIANPGASVENMTLAVYREQSGGTPLWQEVQNVSVDSDGHYSLLMGATASEGMPVDLFSSGESRWLGVQVNRPGEVEQARVLMVSVPYALKASDAETLGGRPASDYLLAAGATTGSAGSTSVANSTGTATSSTPTANATTPVKPKVNNGTTNFIGKFANNVDLVNSVMFEANGNIGIGGVPTTSMELFGATNPIFRVDGAAPGAAVIFNSQTGMGQDRATMAVNAFFNGVWNIINPAIPSWLLQLRTSEDDFGILRAAPGQSDFVNHVLFTVKPSGNIGIGNSAPASKLDVAGDINFTGTVKLAGSTLLQVPGGAANLNTALGIGALGGTPTGGNTVIGAGALPASNSGSNTVVGAQAMQNTTTGGTNTAIGIAALQNLSTGTNNVAIGAQAGLNLAGSNVNNIFIGSRGVASDNNVIRIGNTGTQTAFFAIGVRGVTTANNDAVPVVIDSNGQLGTVSSSRRFKEDIQDMGESSLDLMRLRPVTYRYKQPFADGSKPVQYGLIAEEVAEVYPDLVAHSADGKIETVKYQVLDTMLLNEVQRQQSEIGVQKDQLRRMEQQLNEEHQQNQTLLERLAKLESLINSAGAPVVH